MEQANSNATSSIAQDDNQKNTEDTDREQMLTEEEIDAFIQSEQQAAREGNNADTNSKYTP
jgi:hypothetical protein